MIGDLARARLTLSGHRDSYHLRLLAGLQFNGYGGPRERDGACSLLRSQAAHGDPLAMAWSERCQWPVGVAGAAPTTPVCPEQACGATSRARAAVQAIRSGQTAQLVAALAQLDVNFRSDQGSLLTVAAEVPGPALDELLAAGANANTREPDSGDTPLHVAARHGQRAHVTRLLMAGADPARPNRAGQLPIDVAANQGVRDVLRSQAPSGSDHIGRLRADRVDKVLATATGEQHDELPRAALRHAVRRGDLKLLGAILRRPETDCRTDCPLHLAARLGHADALQLMLAAGADRNQVDGNGKDVLAAAIVSHQDACVRLLWPANPDGSARALLEHFDDLGETLLVEHIGRLSEKRRLVDRPQLEDIARRLGDATRPRAALQWLTAGLPMPPEVRRALIVAAARNGHSRLVVALAPDAGQSDAQQAAGAEALMYAAARDDRAAVRALLDAGTPVDRLDGNGNTALMCAAHAGAVGTYEMLRSAGADAFRRNAFGVSAEVMLRQSQVRDGRRSSRSSA